MIDMAYQRAQKSVRHSSTQKKQSRIAQPSIEIQSETDLLVSPKPSVSSIPSKAERDAIRRSLFEKWAGTSPNQVVQRATTQSSDSYDLGNQSLAEHEEHPNDLLEMYDGYFDKNEEHPNDLLEMYDGYFDEHEEHPNDLGNQSLAEHEEPLATAQPSDDTAANGVVEHSKPEEKTSLFNKFKNFRFPKRHDISGQNAFKDKATSTAQAVASGGISGAEHTHLITHGANLISGMTGAITGSVLSAIGASRSSRQAYRANKRVAIAQNYAHNIEAESTNEDDKKLATILQYMAQKQGRRAKRLGVGAGLGSAAFAAGAASAFTGVVTPPGVALGITSAVLGGASAMATSAPAVGKALYKRSKGTKGKNREANATELYELAKKGHARSLQFLQEPKIKILKEGPRPDIDAQGFYAEDLQDESKKEFIVKYIQQKLRS
jgi:hypothetical protein